MSFILRDMVTGGLLGAPFSGRFFWHGTSDRCEMAPAAGLEYCPSETVLQKVYQIEDQPSGEGPAVTYGDLVYDAENDRVTRTVVSAYPVLPAPDAVAAIKAEASKRILAQYPAWQQTNMIARGVELVQVKAEGGTWTEGEKAEAAALQAAWDGIKAIRAASNTIEADAGSLTQPQIETDSRWPA